MIRINTLLPAMLSAILGMAACSLDPAPSQQEAQPVIVAKPIPREPIAPPPPPVPAPAITTNYLIPHANIELPAPPQIALDHSGREAMFIALDEPGLDDLLPDPVTIWGTTYYTPHYEPLEDGIALIGLDDQPISPPLSRKQARAAAGYVNLIPFNPTAAGAARGYTTPSDEAVRDFHARLRDEHGVSALVRWTSASGRDANGACGQLVTKSARGAAAAGQRTHARSDGP